jgi:hypothetical protein
MQPGIQLLHDLYFVQQIVTLKMLLDNMQLHTPFHGHATLKSPARLRMQLQLPQFDQFKSNWSEQNASMSCNTNSRWATDSRENLNNGPLVPFPLKSL